MFLDDRKSQVFPTLTPVQLQFALNFASGPARRFSPGEKVFNVGYCRRGGLVGRRGQFGRNPPRWAGTRIDLHDVRTGPIQRGG